MNCSIPFLGRYTEKIIEYKLSLLFGYLHGKQCHFVLLFWNTYKTTPIKIHIVKNKVTRCFIV